MMLESSYLEPLFLQEGQSVTEALQRNIPALLRENHGVGIIGGCYEPGLPIQLISELAVRMLGYASIDEFTSATKNSMSALLYADKLSEEEFAALSKPEETHLRTKKVLYGYGSSKEMWMIEALSCGLFPFAIWMPFIKKSF